MTICHGIPWYRNGADDHCPFIIEGWWLFFYPLSYLTLTINVFLKWGKLSCVFFSCSLYTDTADSFPFAYYFLKVMIFKLSGCIHHLL